MSTLPAADPALAPANLEYERAVLGAALLDASSRRAVLTRMQPTDFFDLKNQVVFTRLARMRDVGVPIDLVTVAHALREAGELELAGGPAHLALLEIEASIAAHVPHYLGELIELAGKRGLERLGRQLAHDARNGAGAADIIEALDHAVSKVRGRLMRPARMLRTAAELEAAPPAEPVWLVDQLILEASNGWIGAGAKVGKSYLALDLLLALALGEPWLGRFAVPRPLSVVLLEEEDSRWRVYQRLRRLAAGRGVALPATLHVAVRAGVQLDEPAKLEGFLEELRALRPALVVWDVFNRLHTLDERRPDQVLPLLKRVDRIRDTLGCANLIAHHSRKPSAHGPDLATGGQRLRGPSELWGWAENSLYLSSLKGKGHVLVEPESKDAVIEPFKAHLEDLPDGGRRWVFDGVVEARLAAGEKARAKIVEALADVQLDKQAIADRTGLTARVVERYLPALERDGVLDSYKEPGRTGRKLYLLAQKDTPSLAPADEVPF